MIKLLLKVLNSNKELSIFYLVVFILTFIFFYLFIKQAKSKHLVQTVRIEGPSSHIKKQNTPVLGGLIFVIMFLIFFLYLIKFNITSKFIEIKTILLIICPLIFNFLIGLLDDLKIIFKKKNDGLKANIKFYLQLISSIIVFLILLFTNHQTTLNFFGYTINLNIFYYFLIIFLYLAFPNSVNLTDGLDGLSSSVSLIILSFLGVYAYYKNNIFIFSVIILFIIVLLTFYLFNIKKAWIFMGDTGSLAIGAFLCSLFVILEIEVLSILMCVIFIIETLSVIIQVSYFKLTKGKRIFKMAPIHHHLELIGFKEVTINLIFDIITFVFSLFAFVLGVKLF